MNDKQTRFKDDDEAMSKKNRSEEDVLEAPERTIWMNSIQQLRFGTASSGLEFGSLAWPRGHYILRIEDKDLSQKFPGRSKAEENVMTGQMNTARLLKSKLDCLLVDGWARNPTTTVPRSSYAWCRARVPTMIKTDQLAPRGEKRCEKGYTARYWYMNADAYGAALNQSRLTPLVWTPVVYFKAEESSEEGPQYPTTFGLPARAMSNLLLPVGIPYKAWNRGAEGEVTTKVVQRHIPCKISKAVNGVPIFEAT
jgi:hypothetical protein